MKGVEKCSEDCKKAVSVTCFLYTFKEEAQQWSGFSSHDRKLSTSHAISPTCHGRLNFELDPRQLHRVGHCRNIHLLSRAVSARFLYVVGAVIVLRLLGAKAPTTFQPRCSLSTGINL